MASGDILATFEPQAAHFPSSNYPTFDTRGSHWVLDFDDSTDETCYFRGRIPANYSGSGYTVEVHSAHTATSGNYAWEAAFERVSDSVQDIDADGFAAVNTTGAVAVPSTSGHVDVSTVTFTDGADADSVTAGDGFRLSVNRDVGVTSNATGDANLWLVVIRET